MAVQAYVGSFALNTGTGSQTVTPSGLTFQPKVVLYFGNQLTADTTAAHAMWYVGAAVSATQEACVGFRSTTNQSTGFGTIYRFADRSIQVMPIGTTATAECIADTTGLNLGDFVINLSDAPATPILVHYLLLGGDVTGGQPFEHVLTAGSGHKAFTGLTSQPSAVLFFGASGSTISPTPITFGNVTAMLGWMCADGTQGYCMTRHTHGGPPTATSKRLRTNKCLGLFDVADTEFAEAEWVSMDPTGYTLNFVNAPSSTFRISGLAIYGGAWTSVPFTSNTIVDEGAVPTPDVNPVAVLLQTFGSVASSTSVAGGDRGMGAATATGQRTAIAYDDVDAVNPSVTRSAADTDAMLLTLDANGPAITNSYTPGSFGVETFTYNHTVTNGVAIRILGLVVGDPPSPPGTGDTPELIPARMQISVP